MTEAFDAARTAQRAGAKHITIMSLEARDEMPAPDFEVEEAEHEGIELVNRRGPSRITVRDRKVTGLDTISVTSVFDDDGRFAPVFDKADAVHFEADTIILAIGQAIDLESLGPDGPDIGPRKTIEIDWDSGATSLDDVWSGGDAAKGPRTLIDAIADGRQAATDIHRSFGGDIDAARPGTMVELQQFHRLDDLYDRDDRVDVPTLETGRRVGLAEVELGFTAEQARCEANRCLRCFANILLDVEKCVLCALCADVCPVDVISLAPSEEVDPSVIDGTRLAVGRVSMHPLRALHRALPARRAVDGGMDRSGGTGMTIAERQSDSDSPDSGDRPSGLVDRVRATPVGRSVWRTPNRATPRDRAAGHWSSFLLHIYPVKIRKKELGFKYSWYLGVISTVLLASLIVSGLYLMFFYVPAPASAYTDIQTIQTDVAFGQYVRNVHRWSAHLMVLAVAGHMGKVFYRGGTSRRGNSTG